MLDNVDFETISSATLQGLIDNAIPEGWLYEYKRDAYGGNDEQTREFLKDVSSFANSHGGYLIIGMDEAKQLPVNLTPLTLTDPEKEVARLQSTLQSSIEPRLTGVRIRAIPVGTGHIMVIKIPASWNPPHRVTFKNANRFWVRNSIGAHEPGIHELRVLFTSTATARDRMKAFREVRIAKVAAGEPLIPLISARGRWVLHILPLRSFLNPSPVDLQLAYQNANNFAPMRSNGYSPTYNFDGFLNAGIAARDNYGYVQLFRNGELESVRAQAVGAGNDGAPTCPADVVEREVIESTFNHFTAFKSLGISPPIFIAMTLIDVGGCRLTSRQLPQIADVSRFTQSILPLQEIQIDDYGSREQLAFLMRSAFDSLWNAAGLPGSMNFDTEGKWQPLP